MEIIHHLKTDKSISAKEVVRQIVCEHTGFNRYDIHIASGQEAKKARLILMSMLIKHAKMSNKELSHEFTWKSLSNIVHQKQTITNLLSTDPDFSRLHGLIEDDINSVLN